MPGILSVERKKRPLKDPKQSKNLTEIRWHGRGGQGAKTAAQLLAESAMKAGGWIQAFPEYGPERAGAPIRAFTRISGEPINIHSGIENPDIVVVIDPTLMKTEDVTEGLEEGLLLVNSHKEPVEIREECGYRKGRVAAVDASAISRDLLGMDMPNLPMLGALLKLKGLVSLNELEARVREKFSAKLGEEKTDANWEGVKRAYQEVRTDE
jgi:pyruvate ferredoxin oxidoreductase gamma subunit